MPTYDYVCDACGHAFEECVAADACKGSCDLPKGPDGKVSGPGKCAAVCGSG